MGLDFLTVNQRVHILRPEDKNVYKTLIQQVGDDSFAIQLPMIRDMEVSLPLGQTVEIWVPTPEGRYVLTSLVLGRERDRIPLYRLSLPLSIRRVQARDYVRWKVTMLVNWAPITPAELPHLEGVETDREGITVDLSGGGMLMSTKEPTALGSLLLLRFDLPFRNGVEKISALGMVKRFSVQQGQVPARYFIAVSFERINERHQDIIIGFIFRRMVESRLEI